jgi:hypothetical protein
MSTPIKRRGVMRVGIALAVVSFGLVAAGTVLSGTGSPNSIHVTQTGALTVKASGTWAWEEMAGATDLSYAGFAIDWGDVTSGNAVGTYHIGDGTAATNLVMQPTSPAQGAGGTWGSVSHTYAKAGTYTVCVILYDLGDSQPFKATGYHGLRAGGTDRNTDNSVEQNNQVPAMCETLDVTDPTPSPFQSFQGETATPFQSFQGETSQPTSTPPPTSAASNTPAAPEQGIPMLALALLFGSMLASVMVFKTTRSVR